MSSVDICVANADDLNPRERSKGGEVDLSNAAAANDANFHRILYFAEGAYVSSMTGFRGVELFDGEEKFSSTIALPNAGK